MDGEVGLDQLLAASILVEQRANGDTLLGCGVRIAPVSEGPYHAIPEYPGKAQENGTPDAEMRIAPQRRVQFILAATRPRYTNCLTTHDEAKVT